MTSPAVRIAVIFTVAVLASPSLLGLEAQGGSACSHSARDFYNGTSRQMAPSADGLRLAVRDEFLNSWSLLDDGEPDIRWKGLVEYDEGLREFVLLGNDNLCADGYLDVWAYNTTAGKWRNMRPEVGWTSTPKRNMQNELAVHSMAYDSLHGEMIVFGGVNGETWTYNLSRNSWLKRSPQASPPARSSFSMAFDRSRGVAVLFGGDTDISADGDISPPHLNDTWTYNLTADSWTNRSPAGSPPGTTGHAMAYDENEGVTVLFGGWTTTLTNDTWTYDALANRWTKRTLAGAPLPRRLHSMVYNDAAHKVMVFGGAAPSAKNDIWLLDLKNGAWSDWTPASSPEPRMGQALGFARRGSTAVLYGGLATPGGHGGWPRDTWILNTANSSWSRRPAAAPPSATGCDIAYDGRTGEVVAFGGTGPDGVMRNGTWAFNLSALRWRDLGPAGPPACAATNGMVYDSAKGVMVLSGIREDGTAAGTWTFDPGANRWTDMRPAPTFTNRSFGAQAYDRRAGRTVLFGGIAPGGALLGDTWSYSSQDNAWTDRAPAPGPGARRGHAMAYMERQSQILLFGGAGVSTSALFGDSWVYNCTTNTWTNVTRSFAPPPGQGHSMAYDSSRDCILLTGGTGTGNATWSFNASRMEWSRLQVARAPAPTEGSVIVHDPMRNETVLFGGFSDESLWTGETWAFNHRVLFREGNHTSPPLELKGEAYFGAVRWSADVPYGTSVGIQLRTGASWADMSAGEFIGPDGTPATMYNASGQRVPGVHNGSRWLQYRAFASTTADRLTPLLRSVFLEYNLLHEIRLTSPAGGESWSGTQDITWAASDPDGDRLFVDILRIDGGGSVPVATGVSAGAGRLAWNTSTLRSGEYRLMIIARDDNVSIPLCATAVSGPFNISVPNRPPSAWLVGPSNGSIVGSPDVELRWNGSDDDGDAIDYSLFVVDRDLLPASLPPPVTVTRLTGHIVTGLESNITYYWAVLPSDPMTNGTPSEIWSFTPSFPHSNHPPSVALLGPANGSSSANATVVLGWNGSDPDGDDLSYFLYVSNSSFDPSDPPQPHVVTGQTAYPLGNLANGTYFWTVRPFDGTDTGAAAPVQSFTVRIVVPADYPKIYEWSPKGGKAPVRPNLLVTFDRPMDAASVFASMSIAPAVDLAGFLRSNTSYHFTLGGELAPATTYTITVSTVARSINGQYMAVPFVWTFTTVLAGQIDADLPRVFTTKPELGELYVDGRQNITITFSEAMNKSVTEKSVTILPFVNVSWTWMRSSPFTLMFHPLNPLADGIYTVIVSNNAIDEGGNRLDGNHNGVADITGDSYAFYFTVGKPPTTVPRLLFWSPTTSDVGLNLTIQLVFDSRMSQSSVSSAFETSPRLAGSWSADAEGKVLTFSPSRRPMPGTRYSLRLAANATDVWGNILGREQQWAFSTRPASRQQTELPVIPIALVAAALGAGAAYLALRRKGEKQGEADRDEGPDGVLPPPESVIAAPDEDISIPAGTGSSMPVAPAISIPGGAPPADTLAPLKFQVDGIVLLHRDLRPIFQLPGGKDAREGESGAPGLLKAIGDAAKRSGGSGARLPPGRFGNGTVLVETGENVVLGALVTGPPADEFQDEMATTVRNIESVCAPVLPQWDGKTENLSDARKLLAQLASFVPARPATAQIPAAEVTVRGELGFQHGFVRLTVAVRNRTASALSGASLKLVWNEKALLLDRTEPRMPRDGGTVAIGDIGPMDHRSVRFLLDPQICTESYISAVLTFKDAGGNVATALMPRKMASIVCPILYADQNINTAMLMRLVSEKFSQRDMKVFQIPAGLTPEKAFEVAMSAVQHHDLKLVREFGGQGPFSGEAWYFGRSKGRDDWMVVRARVTAENRQLEFFVASSSTLMLTGMLAELKADLRKEMDLMREKPRMEPVAAPEHVDPVSVLQSLLERADESGRGPSGPRP